MTQILKFSPRRLVAAAVAMVAIPAASGQRLVSPATDETGSVLFLSSTLVPRGETGPDHLKILRWDRDSGFRVFVQRIRENLGAVTNAYRLAAPEVSADGKTIAFVGSRDCTQSGGFFFPRTCAGDLTEETTILRDGADPIVLAGTFRISSNGRWALGDRYHPMRIDLSSGEQLRVPDRLLLSSTNMFVLDDGRICGGSLDSVYFWTPGDQLTTDLPVPFGMMPAAASADGDKVVLSRTPISSFGGPVFILNARTRQLDFVTEGALEASISRNGEMILIRDATSNQLKLVRSDLTERWQITSFPEAVHSVAISGDGRSVLGVTWLSRAFRYQVDTGEMDTLSPPMLDHIPRELSAAQGGFVTLGFAPHSLSPFVSWSYLGLEIKAGETTLPVIHTRNDVFAQIPYDMPPGQYSFPVQSAGHPFPLPPVTIAVTAFQPKTAAYGSGPLTHARDETVVYEQAPAEPGETLHLYLNGLGAVDRYIAPGEPAPFENLARPLLPVRVVFRPAVGSSGVELKVSEAVLLPGEYGVYRLSVSIPSVQQSGTPGVTGGMIELTSPGQSGALQATGLLYVRWP